MEQCQHTADGFESSARQPWNCRTQAETSLPSGGTPRLKQRTKASASGPSPISPETAFICTYATRFNLSSTSPSFQAWLVELNRRHNLTEGCTTWAKVSQCNSSKRSGSLC